jgi:hypothetical protein
MLRCFAPACFGCLGSAAGDFAWDSVRVDPLPAGPLRDAACSRCAASAFSDFYAIVTSVTP